MSDKPADGPRSEAPTLFPLPPAAPAAAPVVGADPKRGARLRQTNRAQITWGRIDLDAQLPEDHAARAISAVIERLDLKALYAQIKARDEVAGTFAIDPRILLGLWVYATSEGEGSAREVWRLTQVHAAYRWICGGVAIGYHTLSDFRSQQGEVVDELITQVLALLMKQELVDLSRVAQDGTRVRASAGASSFRREQTLQALMQEARAHLEAVTGEAADPAVSALRAAARRRGAQERLDRIEAAVRQVPEVTATKQRSGAKDATVRVSTTDPDARVMKMGDGGFRPAFNVQFAATTDHARVIVGVEVTNRGSDMGESTPMLAQIEQRTGVRPRELLVDGGYPGHEAIDKAAALDVTVYAPLPKPRQGDLRDPHAPREDDSEAVAAWRARMATDEAKTIYKERAATAETVNADAKAHRGLDSFGVRGLDKVAGCACLVALTYNILRLITLTT
jgi:transposase